MWTGRGKSRTHWGCRASCGCSLARSLLLKAQAIAARSVAYYNMATSGSICDGQGCQVYSCGSTPGAIHHQAVSETAGMYLSYNNMLTYGFYVAGDNHTSPPSCVGSSGSTERWVTYNEGKTGTAVQQTALGYVGPPGFGQNRGCMSQWGARCLEAHKGYDYAAILRFYYGDDIGVLEASGSCITPVVPKLDADFVSSGSDAMVSSTPDADYDVCAGSTFHFWIEVQNTGTAEWSDTAGSEMGTAIRLGVPGDVNDTLTGTHRISLTEATNDMVRSESHDPPGDDCNDSPGCRRTRFVKGDGIEATAPMSPGLVTTKWRLVDEGRTWFGPTMSLVFHVVTCDSDDAGADDAGADDAGADDAGADDAGADDAGADDAGADDAPDGDAAEQDAQGGSGGDATGGNDGAGEGGSRAWAPGDGDGGREADGCACTLRKRPHERVWTLLVAVAALALVSLRRRGF